MVIVAGSALALVTAGCASGPSHAAAQPNPSTRSAWMCDQCRLVPTRVAHIAGVRPRPYYSYTTEIQMKCPACRSAFENFMAGNGFSHACAICGDTVKERCAGHLN